MKDDLNAFLAIAFVFLLVIMWLMHRKKMQEKKQTITTNSGVKIKDIGEESEFPEHTSEIPIEDSSQTPAYVPPVNQDLLLP